MCSSALTKKALNIRSCSLIHVYVPSNVLMLARCNRHLGQNYGVVEQKDRPKSAQLPYIKCQPKPSLQIWLSRVLRKTDRRVPSCFFKCQHKQIWLSHDSITSHSITFYNALCIAPTFTWGQPSVTWAVNSRSSHLMIRMCLTFHVIIMQQYKKNRKDKSNIY